MKLILSKAARDLKVFFTGAVTKWTGAGQTVETRLPLHSLWPFVKVEMRRQ